MNVIYYSTALLFYHPNVEMGFIILKANTAIQVCFVSASYKTKFNHIKI